MLVLSRKPGEHVCIGPSIRVTVLEARHGKVKLGFAGPPEVPIHREEILRRNRPETEERLQQVGV